MTWVDDLVHFNSGDFIIAVSYPRYAKRMKDLMEELKSYGGGSPLITDSCATN
ncbi:hypothetical protein ACEQPO_27935 [Bacillus sp. SL00103]